MSQSVRISRRRFHVLAGSALATAAASALAQQPHSQRVAASGNGSAMLPTPRTIKCLCCDLNWVRNGNNVRPATPEDWASIDPQEYFDYHREVGNNTIFLQAYNQGGFAYYPSDLGPVAPGRGSLLLPRLWEISRKEKMPFMAYMSVGYENGAYGAWNRHPEWRVPGCENALAPESAWTDLLCRRLREFLKQFPVEWLAFDGFSYGRLCTDYPVQPAAFVEKPFLQIIGRPMPAKASEITPEEGLKYKRVVLARQFHAMRDAIKETSPGTQIGFNVPFWKADDPLWRDHPMVNESEMLWTECTTQNLMEWVLRVRKPGQRVITTFLGPPEGAAQGGSNPRTWKTWYSQGCDFFAYVWGNPPNFRPQPVYDEQMKVVREAFRAIP